VTAPATEAATPLVDEAVSGMTAAAGVDATVSAAAGVEGTAGAGTVDATATTAATAAVAAAGFGTVMPLSACATGAPIKTAETTSGTAQAANLCRSQGDPFPICFSYGGGSLFLAKRLPRTRKPETLLKRGVHPVLAIRSPSFGLLRPSRHGSNTSVGPPPPFKATPAVGSPNARRKSQQRAPVQGA
jgi:hypothetical protein